MKSSAIWTLGLIALSGASNAASHSVNRLNLNGISGVYVEVFSLPNDDGGLSKAENSLELIKVSSTTAYFTIHQAFLHDGFCDLSGIADLKGDALIYQSLKEGDGNPCVFEIKTSSKGILINDVNGACRAGTCSGIHAGYSYGDTVDFLFTSKRPATSLAKLQATYAYQQVLKEHDAMLTAAKLQ